MSQARSPRRSRDALFGKVVGGDYELVELVGTGGMAGVWRAKHTGHPEEVAVKLMGEEVARDAESLRRFEREAQLLSRVGRATSHVARVIDHGVDATLGPFLAMELLSGESLAQRIKRRRRLPPLEVVRIVAELCKALGVAHSMGVTHRDVKPANIFLHRPHGDRPETVKLLDFGVAKQRADDDLGASTRAGTVVGTVHYMSPEQLRGETRVDSRADLWSVGVVVYRMLVGHAPFSLGPSSELAARIFAQEPTPPSSVVRYLPRELDAWVEKALAKRADDRFANAQALVLGLADALAAPCDTATEPTLSSRSGTKRKRHAKGVNLIDLVKALRKARRDGRLGELSEEDAALLDQRILVSEWYPIESFWRLLELAHLCLLDGSDDKTIFLGMAGATNVMSTVHSAYVSNQDFERALRRFERGWASYFDFGTVETRQEGNVLRFTIRGYPDVPRTHALTTLGWCRATLSLVGVEVTYAKIATEPWAGANALVLEYGLSERR